MSDALFAARARVLRDLAAYGMDTGPTVSVVDEVLTSRRWWLDQWPDGAAYIACLVAQDVQEALLESVGRWPMCVRSHEDQEEVVSPHELRVAPDLGDDPHWVCGEDGTVVASVGELSRRG